MLFCETVSAPSIFTLLLKSTSVSIIKSAPGAIVKLEVIVVISLKVDGLLKIELLLNVEVF